MPDTRPARIWGCNKDDLPSGFTDYIMNSKTTNKTAQTAEARDEYGKLIDLAAYDIGTEITMEALVTENSSNTDVGQKIEVGGIDALITGISKNESNSDFQRATITLRQGNSDTIVHTVSDIQG